MSFARRRGWGLRWAAHDPPARSADERDGERVMNYHYVLWPIWGALIGISIALNRIADVIEALKQ